MSWIAKELTRMQARIAELERRLENSARQGPVRAVDAEKGLVRLEVGRAPDGTPQLGPWVPYSQMAGGLKIHAPPSEGQTMMQVAPGGDFEQAVAVPLSWSNANPSPSGKGDENVMTFGSATFGLRGNEVTLDVPRLLVTCEGTTFEVTGQGIRVVGDIDHDGAFDGQGGARIRGGLELLGGRVSHDGRNIGSNHVHSGVRSGGDRSSIPDA